MNSLEKRYDKERKDKNAFARWSKLCERQVVRWEYWDDAYWHWDPEEIGYHAERTKDHATYLYGYDKRGRIVVMRHGLLWQDQNASSWHDFLQYSEKGLQGACFFKDRFLSVFEATLSENRVTHVTLCGAKPGPPPSWDWKTIQWKRDKVSKVKMGIISDTRKLHVFETTYDNSGNAVAEVELTKKRNKPLPKGVTMQSLATEIRERLIKAVVKTVTKARIRQPVYCLALNYDCEGNPILPPELGIGLDSERKARLKRGGRDAKLDIWEPEQFKHFANEHTELNDPKLEKACDLFNTELEKKKSAAPAHQLLNEAAAELSRLDWTGKLKTTGDFVAYAVDTDGVDLKKNLRFSTPPERWKQLRTTKLI